MVTETGWKNNILFELMSKQLVTSQQHSLKRKQYQNKMQVAEKEEGERGEAVRNLHICYRTILRQEQRPG